MNSLQTRYIDYCGAYSRAKILATLFVLATLWQLILVTHGTFNLFGPETLDQVFNFMFYRLTQGRMDLEREVTSFETFVYKGKDYSYFNMFPAMLRVFIWPFTDLSDFKDSLSIARLSCWLANVLACFFQGLLIARLFRNVPENRANNTLFGFVLAALFFCGVAVFMTSLSPIFREPLLWARCFSSLFLLVLFCGTLDKLRFTGKMLAIMALCAGLALHNRVTVAIGLYICLCGLMCLIAAQQGSTQKTGTKELMSKVITNLFGRKYITAFAIMFVFGVLALTVNYLRWEDPLKFAHYTGYKILQEDPVRLRSFNEAGLFDIGRIPESLVFYLFGNEHTNLWAQTNFFTPFDGKQHPTPEPLILMQPVFLLFMLFGFSSWFKKPQEPYGKQHSLIKPVLIWAAFCFLVTCLLKLSFMYTSFRYSTDFQPFALVVGCTGLLGLVHPELRTIQLPVKRLNIGLGVLLCIGLFATHRLMATLKADNYYTNDPHAPEFVFNWFQWIL